MPGDVHCGPEVYLEEVAAVLDGNAFELAEEAVAGVVDDYIDPAEFGESGVEGGADGGLRGEVYRLQKGIFFMRCWWQWDRFGAAGEGYDAVGGVGGEDGGYEGETYSGGGACYCWILR